MTARKRREVPSGFARRRVHLEEGPRALPESGQMIALIVMRYMERDFDRTTMACVRAAEHHFSTIIYADRDGVGNMSRAFNEAFQRCQPADKVWFLTNVEFEPDVPLKLAAAIDEHQLAAVHPAHGSHHQFLQPDGSGLVRQVPFVEFTAPMFRWADFHRFLLDEDHWFWYMDLIISKQMREAGLRMGAHHGAPIGHDYLRGFDGRKKKRERITEIRDELRKWRDAIERPILETKFGPRWRDILWCR